MRNDRLKQPNPFRRQSQHILCARKGSFASQQPMKHYRHGGVHETGDGVQVDGSRMQGSNKPRRALRDAEVMMDNEVEVGSDQSQRVTGYRLQVIGYRLQRSVMRPNILIFDFLVSRISTGRSDGACLIVCAIDDTTNRTPLRGFRNSH